tara:strand:+ start:624 stop:899 length:276 start_codon:yes stop_codon:yes gene_type:complete
MKKSRSKRKSKISYGNIFKVSLVSGAGTFLGIVPQLIVAILFFTLGLSLKNEADRNESQGFYYYSGIAIMILGSALGLGMGTNILFSEIFE